MGRTSPLKELTNLLKIMKGTEEERENVLENILSENFEKALPYAKKAFLKNYSRNQNLKTTVKNLAQMLYFTSAQTVRMAREEYKKETSKGKAWQDTHGEQDAPGAKFGPNGEIEMVYSPTENAYVPL